LLLAGELAEGRLLALLLGLERGKLIGAGICHRHLRGHRAHQQA